MQSGCDVEGHLLLGSVPLGITSDLLYTSNVCWCGGAACLTFCLSSLLQLVYPYDFRLTEKEVTAPSFLFLKMLGSSGRFSHRLFLFVAEDQYLLLVLPGLLLR